MDSKISSENVSQLERDISDLFASGVDAAHFASKLLLDIPVLVSVMDGDGKVLFASAYHNELSGVPDSLSEIKTEKDLFPAFVNKRFLPSLSQSVINDDLATWEFSAPLKNGSVCVYSVRHQILAAESSKKTFILSIGIDVTGISEINSAALQDHKSQLNYLSFHDPLTGLANRSLFYDRVNKSLSRSRRNTSNLSLLLVDLDRFKNINDSLGRDAGDYYLKQAALRLAETVRDTDTVARLSGDEFVIVLENVAQASDITGICQKILDSISQPLSVMGHEITSTASIGVSLYPRDGDSIDQLLKHADLAMSRAKHLGKNRTEFYVKAMTENAVNYLLLENDLRRAIDNDELCLHYQPQIDLQSGRIAGVEALVRWEHPDRGLIPPAEFIPLAEETGLIQPLGNWVLKTACMHFQSWLVKGFNFGKVAVNLSPRQFRQDNFDAIIVDTLEEAALAPEYLELEITESSVMENAAETIELLNVFAKMGLSLAIDDFGTGYSSLAYLKRFPINKLKIDRSFINDIDVDEADSAIAKSIIDLAHNMSLQVVAEGVERPTQSRWLNEKGCDHVQGFYYARPMAEEKLLELVEDSARVIVCDGRIRLLSSS